MLKNFFVDCEERESERGREGERERGREVLKGKTFW
jgi:hypothetical protein